MEAINIEALRSRFVDERESYVKLAEVVAEHTRSLAHSAGIPCHVSHRAKDIASFLKKALKGKYSDPYAEIRDKAGVRVVALYPWDVGAIESLVRKAFTVIHHEDTRATIPVKVLDYRGTHFEVKYGAATAGCADLLCEIQILTKAESLWADTAHYLSYKPAQPPSEPVQRAIYRLIALVEIFDSEVERAHQLLSSDMGYEEAKLLQVVEEHYYRFTAKQSDRALSLQILSMLTKVEHPDVWNQFEKSMRDFVSDNSAKLAELYERYLDDDLANPLIWQPETLLIFLLLEADSFSLANVWQDEYPQELLVSLADSWGAAIATD